MKNTRSLCSSFLTGRGTRSKKRTEGTRKSSGIFFAQGPGLKLTDWTLAAWVGNIGLFYDFSQEVTAGICERREERLRLKNAAAAAITATVLGVST